MRDKPAFPDTADLVPYFVHLDRVASTNTELKAHGGLQPFSLLLSTNQTHGRGRRERTWDSQPGESLALSVVVPAEEARLFANSWVPLVVGWAVVQSLTSLGVAGAGLKWPNDVLVSGRKVAGILCEILPDGQVMVGVGTNLVFEHAGPTRQAVALAELCVLRDETPDRYAAQIIRGLRESLTFSPGFVFSQVSEVMSTLGREVNVVEPDQSSWNGQALRLDEDGHLVVRDWSGGERVLVAGDVEHVLQ